MKNLKINSRNLLGFALMGAFVGAPLMAPMAQAKPPAHAKAYGRDKDKKNKKDKRDDRRNDRDDNYDNRDDRNNSGDNYRNDARYTGVVTAVRSGNSFDVRVNGKTYNVYTSGNVPRGLSVGDTVRVAGRPYGDNDIRQATVNITNNTRDNTNRDNRDNTNYGPYRTYTGTVENAGSGNEFNARVNGRIYKIYTSSSVRNLRVGDTVRIYGQMYNNRDIRNANVTGGGGRNGDRYDPNNKGDDRYNDRNDGGYTNDNFQTFTGVVTKVRNSREFDIVVNLRTYNVYASQGTNNLNKNDVVRVYGRRFGDNDIRDANVSITRNR